MYRRRLLGPVLTATLALGVSPVGVREWFGEQPNAVWPWAQDELGEVEQAEQLVADVEAQIQSTAEAHPAFARRPSWSGSRAPTLSPERFGDLGADVLVWVGGDAAAFEHVTSVPTDPSRVAEEGRDLFLPYDPFGGAISYSSVLSLPFLVEELVPQLEVVLDGDPSTTSEFAR